MTPDCTSLSPIKGAEGTFELNTPLISSAGLAVKERLNLALQKQQLTQGSVVVTAPGFLPSKKILFFIQTLPLSYPSCLKTLCEVIAKEQIEHISFDLSETLLDDTAIIIDALEELVKKENYAGLRRVSFITKNHESYLNTQKILFTNSPTKAKPNSSKNGSRI